MKRRRVTAEEYIQFLLASSGSKSALEHSRVHPEKASHDAITCLFQRGEEGPLELWYEVQHEIKEPGGVLILNDSTLDKPYSKKIELVSYH